MRNANVNSLSGKNSALGRNRSIKASCAVRGDGGAANQRGGHNAALADHHVLAIHARRRAPRDIPGCGRVCVLCLRAD